MRNLKLLYCNNWSFFSTKLPWPGDSDGTFWSSSQAFTCPSVYCTRRRLRTVPFNAELQARKLWISICIVFNLNCFKLLSKVKSKLETMYKTIMLPIGFFAVRLYRGAFLQSVPIYLRPIAFFSFTLVKYGSLALKQRHFYGVVVRARVCQVSRSSSNRAALFLILFLQNLALELGFGQRCQAER